MKTGKPPVWYHVNELLTKDTVLYTKQYPPYFNSADYDWCAQLAPHYKLFKHEFEQYVANNNLRPYFYKEQAAFTGKWKTVPVITWGIQRKKARQFPQTSKLLNQIPGLVSVSFSLLEPGGSINPHRGDTDAVIRAHFCLAAPTQGDIHFTVDGVKSYWQDGGWILFCDAYLHGGFNNTPEPRLIMILDVLHPEHLAEKNKVCARVMAGLLLNYMLVLLKVNIDTNNVPQICRPFYWIFYRILKVLGWAKIRL